MNITLTTQMQGSISSVQLIQECRGIDSEEMFVCIVLRHDVESRTQIPASELEDILQALRVAKIPMVGDCPMGVDGQSFELKIENGMASSSYRWWLKPNEKWHVLSDIANKLRQLGFEVSGLY